MNTTNTTPLAHKSMTNTDLDFAVAFHCGPSMMISGEVLSGSDNSKLISCPAHDLFYLSILNTQTNEITTISNKCVMKLGPMTPKDVNNEIFLNTSLKQQNDDDFDENELSSINIFDSKVADHLYYTDCNEEDGSDNDANIIFDGEILKIDNFMGQEVFGAYHNYQYSAIAFELNPNNDIDDNYGLLLTTYSVPSKYINNLDNWETLQPCMEYFGFKTKSEAIQIIEELKSKYPDFIQSLVHIFE